MEIKNMELYGLTAHELLAKLKKREISCEELILSVYKRIDEVEDRIKAYISLDKDEAIKQARDTDKKGAGGAGGLSGIPIAIKDNMNVKGIRTTCASRILSNFVSVYDAFVIRKLKEAGTIFVGKTNMDEFAMGSSTETSHSGVTRNPWDTDTIPGGSSGGSAAAIASDETILSLGSDTGGSIRQPAACCGVVGLKPTYGRVSRFGLVAFASSLDQIGPITKDVTDSALLMNVIAGYDPGDSTSVNKAVPDYTKSLINGVKKTRIGIPKEYFVKGMDGEVESAVRAAVKLLEQSGATASEISLPHTEYAVADYYIIAPSEASANLARYDGVKYGYRSEDKAGKLSLIEMYEETRGEGFGAEVKRRIMIGTYALSSGYYDAYYLKAQKVRTLIKKDFDDAFRQVDVIITPASPTPAFRIGEKTDDPLQMYLSDIFTISANLAGIPGMCLPCGFARKTGLPIGLQILAKPFDEESIFKVAYTYEQNTDWHTKKPEII